MTAPKQLWAGVDVGASKGLDLAVIDRERLVAGPERLTKIVDAVDWLHEHRPRVVAVDGPRSPAPKGQLSRKAERDLVRAGVCGIRYTPDKAALGRNRTYYAWIANGLRLYAALDATMPAAGWKLIECFPTATWSRLGGPRGSRSRERWSREILGGLGLDSLPNRMNQDARDAIGAALTARLYEDGMTEAFGEIEVPRRA
jgi:predicted nuclease with RNAse H fold